MDKNAHERILGTQWLAQDSSILPFLHLDERKSRLGSVFLWVAGQDAFGRLFSVFPPTLTEQNKTPEKSYEKMTAWESRSM
jgi:hypothetical protein